MEIIDIPLEGRQDHDGLRTFLGACRDAADTDGHSKIASISLRVRHIDPLAVLDSIYEREAHHFYMENSSREWAVAGAESVTFRSFQGPTRFREVKAFARELDEHIICIGDATLPMARPLFFAGFTFFDSGKEGNEAFPPALVFVPQWQVARVGNRYIAVANALIEPGMDIESVADRIWNAHTKFTTFSYERPEAAPVYHILEEKEVGPERKFHENVQAALGKIHSGQYEKIVLSRAVDLSFDNSCQPLRILNRPRNDYPNCNTFSLQNDHGTSFIGATPERLITVQDGKFFTEAIAGSAARDDSAFVDARLAGNLLGSEKDMREHNHVVKSIASRLASLGLEASRSECPGLLVLPNVQHLCTPLHGAMNSDLHILDLAEALHPTPAVGGTPRDQALPDIAAWEPFPRGMFAGLTGWFDTQGNGEFAVGIRSALVRDQRARLFAGAGIVAGSEIESEFRETSLKMEALLRCIRGAAG